MKWISNYSSDVDLYAAILDFKGNHFHNRYIKQKRLNPHYNKKYRVKENYNGLHNRVWGMTAPCYFNGKPTNIFNPLIKGSVVVDLINSPNNTDWVECKYYINDADKQSETDKYKKYIKEIYKEIFSKKIGVLKQRPSDKEIDDAIDNDNEILFENNEKVSKIMRPTTAIIINTYKNIRVNR